MNICYEIRVDLYVIKLINFSAIISIGFICIKNINGFKNILSIKTWLTIGATVCIFCYRVTSLSIHVPFYFPALNEVLSVRIFWILIFAMMISDIVQSTNYLSNNNGSKMTRKYKSQKRSESLEETSSVYIQPNRPKQRNIDSNLHEIHSTDMHPTSQLLSESFVANNEPCTKMHILTCRTNTFLNIMILVCSLLLRPHNLILVPSLYMTSKCINNILDYKLGSRLFRFDTAKDDTESKNTFCKTIFHIWIGAVFYFYQVSINILY